MIARAEAKPMGREWTSMMKSKVAATRWAEKLDQGPEVASELFFRRREILAKI